MKNPHNEGIMHYSGDVALQKRLEINDACRANFTKYTRKAFEAIPVIEKPNILDLGCGTGVPTLEIARLSNGKIVAVDTDRECVDWFKQKIMRLNYEDRISVIRKSVLRIDVPEHSFDIILAEGLFNIIGFEKALSRFLKLLKPNGYFMIHDDFRYRAKKQKIIEKYKLLFVKSFVLDETVWWKEYCSCLEKKIEDFEKEWGNRVNTKRLFSREISELAMYRKNPERFRSVYFVLKKVG